MSDYRLFIKIHHGFPEHPKTGGLSDRAFRNLIEMWCYCARNLTDGIVTKAQSKKILTTKSSRELIDAGYMIERTDSFEMKGYLEHQMSAQQVADLRELRSEAGKRGGKAKANHLASARANALANAKQTSSKPVAEVEVEVEIEEEHKTTTRQLPSSTPLASKATDPEPMPWIFTEFWRHYPRKVGKEAARKSWRTAIRKADPDLILAAAVRYGNDPNLPSENFIPHPSTWLNEGRWSDPPQPSRTATPAPKRSTTDDRVAQNLAFIAAVAAEDNPEPRRQIGSR